MASVFPFQRLVLASLMALPLVGCTTDDLSPSARIDTSTRVSAIPQDRGREQSAQQRTSETAYPMNDVTGADTAVTDSAALARTPRQARRPLPMIDSGDSATASDIGRRTMTVPAEGVDMDAMLGVAPAKDRVVGLAEDESREIAEGNSSQPVVGGIGSDQVRQLGGKAVSMGTLDEADPDLPLLTDEKREREAARQAQFLDQQQRVMLRPADTGREQNVAFLPRVDNPLSEPQAEPDFTGQMPAEEVACRQRLRKLRVEFTDIPRISNGPACGIDYPIQLTGLSGGIDVKPAVKLNCQVTEAFALWVKNELAPSARYRYFSGVKTIKPLGGYSCRTMNSQAGNPMSEHAHGNAIDVGKFVLNSGKEIDVRKPGFFAFREKGLLKAVRSDSCKYFNTVLGPGSDPHHKDHFHFDLRARKSGYRHCD